MIGHNGTAPSSTVFVDEQGAWSTRSILGGSGVMGIRPRRHRELPHCEPGHLKLEERTKHVPFSGIHRRSTVARWLSSVCTLRIREGCYTFGVDIGSNL